MPSSPQGDVWRSGLAPESRAHPGKWWDVGIPNVCSTLVGCVQQGLSIVQSRALQPPSSSPARHANVPQHHEGLRSGPGRSAPPGPLLLGCGPTAGFRYGCVPVSGCPSLPAWEPHSHGWDLHSGLWGTATSAGAPSWREGLYGFPWRIWHEGLDV